MLRITIQFRTIICILAIAAAATTAHASSSELPLVISVCSYNCAPWVTQNLDSIFSQKYENFRVVYVDDASTDATVELVKEYIQTHALEDKITLIANPSRVGKMKNVYNVIHACQDREIIVQIDADDWLPHTHVFQRIQQTYASGDVWLSYSDFDAYPAGTEEWCTPMPVPDHIIAKGAYRNWKWVFTHIRTFYSWLYKSVRLEDFIAETSPGFIGKFFPLCNDMASFFPMLEMCGPHFMFIPEKLYVYNRDNPNLGAKLQGHLYKPIGEDIRKRKKYKKIERPILNRLDAFKTAQADLIIIATSTVGMLLKLLNSLDEFATGINNITVIYQKNKREMKKFAAQYPHIQCMPITDQSIVSMLQDVAQKSSQGHILIAKDSIFAHEPLDLHACIVELETTQAHGFYLGYSHHQSPFYSQETTQELVPHQHVWQNIHAWKFNAGQPILYNNIDMTLFDKQTLLKRLSSLPDSSSIHSFLKSWQKNNTINQHRVGLFYETPKLSGDLNCTGTANYTSTATIPTHMSMREYVQSILQSSPYQASEKQHIPTANIEKYKEALQTNTPK